MTSLTTRAPVGVWHVSRCGWRAPGDQTEEQCQQLIRAQHIIRAGSAIDTKQCGVLRDLGEEITAISRGGRRMVLSSHMCPRSYSGPLAVLLRLRSQLQHVFLWSRMLTLTTTSSPYGA